MRRRGARQRMRSAGATRRLLRGGAHPLAVPLMLPKLRSTQQSVPVPRHSACAQTSKQAEHRLRVMCTLLAGCGLETAPYVTGADTRLVRAPLVTRLTASVHHHGAAWCHCSSPRLRCGRQARAGGGRAARARGEAAPPGRATPQAQGGARRRSPAPRPCAAGDGLLAHQARSLFSAVQTQEKKQLAAAMPRAVPCTGPRARSWVRLRPQPRRSFCARASGGLGAP